MSDSHDPILEAGLAELLGGATPPDLSVRILLAAQRLEQQRLEHQRLEQQPAVGSPTVVGRNGMHVGQHGVGSNGVGSNGMIPHGPAVEVRPAEVETTTDPGLYRRAAFRVLGRRFGWVASTAALVAAAVLIGYAQFRDHMGLPNGSPNPPVATHPAPTTTDPSPTPEPPAPSHAAPTDAPPSQTNPPQTSPPQTRPPRPSAPFRPWNDGAGSVASDADNRLRGMNGNVGISNQGMSTSAPPAPESVVREPYNPETVYAAPTSTGPKRRTFQPSPEGDVLAAVDGFIEQGWSDAGVRPSPSATDEEWCRRVYLDVLGRIPSYPELLRFLQDDSPNKRVWLVDQLLASDTYDVEYARHWTTVWANLLIGRAGGDDPNRPVNRDGLEQWLRRRLLANTPYDQFVTELLTAQGANTPGEPSFNGAVNFLLDNLQADQVPATNKVAELFLGQRVSCTQCHNHPFSDGTQHGFWELNAFFKQARVRRSLAPGSPDKGSRFAVLVDEDFAGESRSPTPHEAEIYYELRNGMWKVAYPRFEGQSIDRTGFVDVVNRRRELARLVLDSPSAPRSFVNRMWAHFLGFGFTKPVDDMGLHNPPSHPELLDRLANEFTAHGHDVKRLIRWIVLSKPYALSSRIVKGPGGNERDDPAVVDPTRGERLVFSRYYTRQMAAEEVYQSLVVARFGEPRQETKLDRDQHDWVQQFVVNFDTDDNCESSNFDGGFPQMLMMLNGSLVDQAVKGSFVKQLLHDKKLSPQAKVERIFTTALGRKPAAHELSLFSKQLPNYRGDVSAWLEDVYWTVLNSPEFIIKH